MDNNRKVFHRINPRLEANIFSKLFLTWMFPYLYGRRRHELKEKDIFQLAPENQSELLGNKLEKCWKAEVEEAQRKQRKPSFLKVIIKTFGCNYLKYAIFSFASSVSPMLLPLVLRGFISHFDKNSTSTTLEGFSHVLLLILTFIVCALLEVNSKFSMLYIGGQVKTACSALIYRKLLRIPIHTQGDSDEGKLITLLSTDVTRFEEVFSFLHTIFSLPILLIMNGLLLWRIFGVTTVFTVLIVTAQNIPFQVFSAILITKLRKKVARRTDDRLLLMDEIINGIRVIKMYTWEKPFAQFALAVRRKELNLIAKKLCFHFGIRDYFRYSTCITLYITIALLISYEDKVTSLILIPLIHYNYDMNLQSGYLLSRCLGSLADATATVARIEDFLLLKEVTPFLKLSKPNNRDNVVVILKNLSASWPEYEDRTILKDVSISIDAKKLYALVGDIRSGKSSLLKVILGELKPKSGEVFNYGDISFANQEPWLFNGSIRSNILLGEPFDEKKYNQVIRSCALLKDFDQLPHGDKTIVGERGAILSGGQSVRVNLARAIYRNAELYLLDDPLASIDCFVSKYLFENCIKGLLKNKATILITQKLEYIKEVDEIIFINNGQLEYQGDYVNFQNTEFFQYLFKCRDLDSTPNTRIVPSNAISSSVNVRNIIENEIPLPDENEECLKDYKKSAVRKPCNDFHKDSDKTRLSFVHVNSGGNETDESNESEELLNEYTNDVTLKPYQDPEENVEQIKQGKIQLSILREFYNNNCLIVFTAIFFVMAHSFVGIFDYAIAVWAQNQDDHFASSNSTNLNNFHTNSNFSDSQIRLFYITGGIIVGMLISSIIQLILFVKLHKVACARLHNNMISSLLNATVQFFDRNDSGRILNRFSQDLGTVDEQVVMLVMELAKIIITTFAAVLQIVISSLYMSIPVIVSLILVCKVNFFFCKFIISLKRLEARAKAIVLSHSNATLNGLITIRSFGAQAMVQRNFNIQQDNYMAAYFTFNDIVWSYSLWIEIVIKFFIALAAISFLFLKTTGITSATVGYIMFQIYVINRRIKISADYVTQFQSVIISLERTLEYTKLNQENITKKNGLAHSLGIWPSDGKIKFDHLHLKYSNLVEAVLKNINLDIEPGMKVGIIGRTGAGKSSLVAALFRLADTEGSVFIDDVDIKSVPLNDLRSKISILPQKSILFSTSLKKNLDPLELYDDATIWSALRGVQLDKIFHSLDEELNQKSLSSGQRQLLCLARAILKKNKILILDEASANVDARSDDLIHKTIKENFRDSTVLTISHKLNSVKDCDKILVIVEGQVVQFDKPRVLLEEKGGYFYKMWHTLNHLS